MSKPQWSPGPWERLDCANGQRLIKEPKGYLVCEVFPRGNGAWAANADLIAAAPEMAALLERVYDDAPDGLPRRHPRPARAPRARGRGDGGGDTYGEGERVSCVDCQREVRAVACVSGCGRLVCRECAPFGRCGRCSDYGVYEDDEDDEESDTTESDTTERPGRRVARLRREAPKCEWCGAVAICWGREGDDETPRCNTHCGHSAEEACWPVDTSALAAARRERWRLGEAIERARATEARHRSRARAMGHDHAISDAAVLARLCRGEAWGLARKRLSALADRLAREVPEAALIAERKARQEEARKRREGQQP